MIHGGCSRGLCGRPGWRRGARPLRRAPHRRHASPRPYHAGRAVAGVGINRRFACQLPFPMTTAPVGRRCDSAARLPRPSAAHPTSWLRCSHAGVGRHRNCGLAFRCARCRRAGAVHHRAMDGQAAAAPPCGHPLRPGHTLVGSIACSCGCHLMWRCEWGAVTYGPAPANRPRYGTCWLASGDTIVTWNDGGLAA